MNNKTLSVCLFLSLITFSKTSLGEFLKGRINSVVRPSENQTTKPHQRQIGSAESHIFMVRPSENQTTKPHPEKSATRALSSANTGYAKAQEYFNQRKRPLRHFLDIGIGATLIESFYPFELTAYPFLIYANYRRERWGQLKMPLSLSLQYAPLFNRQTSNRIYTLVGFRYPTSHDLKLFHVGFKMGMSFPLDFSFKINRPALELRLLFTHIIGPKNSAHRLYFQWGPKASLTTKQFRSGLIANIGLDNHL